MDNRNWAAELCVSLLQMTGCMLGTVVYGPGLSQRLKRAPTFEEWVGFVQEKAQKDEFERQLKAFGDSLMKQNNWQIIHDYVWEEKPKELGPPD